MSRCFAALLLAVVGPLLAGNAHAEKKPRMILSVSSFESTGPRGFTWKKDPTVELGHVDGLGERIKLGVGRESRLPYVQIWPSVVDPAGAPTPIRVPLPLSEKDTEAVAINIRLTKDGTVLIAGNETSPAWGLPVALARLPSVWAWRPGGGVSEWKQWILDPKMLARSTKVNIWIIQAVFGFEMDTGRLVCMVKKDKEVGLAFFEVQIVDPERR